MHVTPFATERFFAIHEFRAPYLLCASDCETLSIAELLELGGSSLAELGNLRLGYTESVGMPSLRAQIAAQYRSVAPDDILTLSAPEEGIFIMMRALLQPSDRVVVLAPCYDSLANVAADIGCTVARWQAQPTATGWQLDLDALEALLAEPTRLLVVNAPHNPTGLLPTPAEQQQILALAERAGCLLFSDEMYRGLELEGRESLPSACELSGSAVTLSGLSKTHGLPGLRSGWLVTHNAALREQLIDWKLYTTICSAGPSELLAEVGLRAAAKLARRNRARIEANLRLADAFFAKHSEHFVWRRPQAGSVALVELCGNEGATAFSERVLAGCGVLLLPGTYFGTTDRWLRVGLGRDSFAEALAVLDAWLTGQ